MIETSRLKSVLSAPEHLSALIECDDRFAASFGTPPADGLRAFFVSGGVSPEWVAQLRFAQGADSWKWGFCVVDRDTNQVVGTLGFKGPPDDEGIVEIA